MLWVPGLYILTCQGLPSHLHQSISFIFKAIATALYSSSLSSDPTLRGTQEVSSLWGNKWMNKWFKKLKEVGYQWMIYSSQRGISLASWPQSVSAVSRRLRGDKVIQARCKCLFLLSLWPKSMGPCWCLFWVLCSETWGSSWVVRCLADESFHGRISKLLVLVPW